MKTDNELIAEFMGLIRYEPNSRYNLPQWYQPDSSDGRKKGKFMGYPEQLKYDTKWDWIMPVVEKIARIETKDVIHNGEDSYFDSFFPRTFGMINSETKHFMVRINRNPLHQSQSLMEATYSAVVDFIKWYNQQKP